MELIPACGYLRNSSEPQETSIPIQKLRVQEIPGYEIVEWFVDEGRSGSRNQEKRIDWYKMLAKAPDAAWKAVLCFNVARFARLDILDSSFAKKTLRDNDIFLHSYVEGKMDWNTGAGLMIDAIHTTMSNEYSANLGQHTLEGKLKAFLDGRAHGQSCNYGYNRLITDPQGVQHLISRKIWFRKPKDWAQVFVPGELEEIETVLWLFKTYAKKDVGYRWLARQLNLKKILSPRGLKWDAERVHRILINEVYLGHTRLGLRGVGSFARLDGDKVIKKRYGKRHDKKEGLLRKNTHEPLISQELWDEVQEKLKANSMRIRYGGRNEAGYALKGLLICGHCGFPLYGVRNRGDKKSRRVAYLCKNAVRYGSESGCSQWSVQEIDALPLVIGKFTKTVDLALLEKDSVQPPRSEQTKPKDPSAGLVRKRAELERKIAQGAERFLTAPASLMKDLESKLNEWKAERAQLDKEIEKSRKEVESPEGQLREWQQWFASIGKELVHVQTNPEGSKLEEGLKFTPATFRQTLQNFGCRVIFWWKQRSDRRWDVDRVRLLLGVREKVELLNGRTVKKKRLSVAEMPAIPRPVEETVSGPRPKYAVNQEKQGVVTAAQFETSTSDIV